MKRLIPFFLAFLMLLSLCGCRGSFGSIDLQDAIEIPEDGIVKESTIEQIKEKNAIAAFYGESNGCKYEGPRGFMQNFSCSALLRCRLGK